MSPRLHQHYQNTQAHTNRGFDCVISVGKRRGQSRLLPAPAAQRELGNILAVGKKKGERETNRQVCAHSFYFHPRCRWLEFARSCLVGFSFSFFSLLRFRIRHLPKGKTSLTRSGDRNWFSPLFFFSSFVLLCFFFSRITLNKSTDGRNAS